MVFRNCPRRTLPSAPSEMGVIRDNYGRRGPPPSAGPSTRVPLQHQMVTLVCPRKEKRNSRLLSRMMPPKYSSRLCLIPFTFVISITYASRNDLSIVQQRHGCNRHRQVYRTFFVQLGGASPGELTQFLPPGPVINRTVHKSHQRIRSCC